MVGPTRRGGLEGGASSQPGRANRQATMRGAVDVRASVGPRRRSLARLGVCVLLLGASSCGEAYTAGDLVGTWRGSSAEWSAATLTVEPDGSVSLQYVDRNGSAHTVTGRVETDFSKRPIPLSIRRIPQLPHPLHTVVEFKGRDHLRIGSFAPRWRLRPISFDPHTEVLLERQ